MIIRKKKWNAINNISLITLHDFNKWLFTKIIVTEKEFLSFSIIFISVINKLRKPSWDMILYIAGNGQFSDTNSR
jgi:hypothetical protein